MRISGLACSLALVLALGGCSADPKAPKDVDDDLPDPAATLSRIQAEIFTPKCAFSGCHGDPAQLGMNLEAGNAHGNIVGVTAKESSKLRIAPNDPDGSYLIDKIKGRPGIVGNQMPDGGPPLSDEEIALIVDWVRLGAQDN